MKKEFLGLLNKYHKGEINLSNVKDHIDCIVTEEIIKGKVDTDEIVDLIDCLVINYLEVCEELKTYN